MILIHDKATRGHSRMGWLDSAHTFSFGGFNDPKRMGFGNLRVLNEDHVIPGAGFAPHQHDNMDILTLVLSGALRHEDNQGNVQTIRAGEVQLMSAGAEVEHSEWNASDTDIAHFLQIWMIPDHMGGAPYYGQAIVPLDQTEVVIAGGAGSGALLPLRSGSTIRLLKGHEGETLALGHPTALTFAHVIDGLADAEGEHVSAGDGLQLPKGEDVVLTWQTDWTAIVFTMPGRARGH